MTTRAPKGGAEQRERSRGSLWRAADDEVVAQWRAISCMTSLVVGC
jgi:hypothetical protein